MKKWLGCAALAAVFAVPATAAAGELRLSIANGRVTIVAQDVTVKQILDEWSRVGQTKVVGAERLVGTLVTLELHDVPEGRALILLPSSVMNWSTFDLGNWMGEVFPFERSVFTCFW